MSHKICTIPEIDTSSFKFKIADAKGAKGGKSIYFYHGGKPLYFQTPVVRVPFGVTCWDDTQPKYTLNLAMSDPAFLEKIKEIESRIIDEAFNDSQAWFKKKYANRDVVEELFTSCLRYSKDKDTGEITDKYPPTMKLNMTFMDDVFTCEGYKKTVIKDQPNEIAPLTITKDTIYKGANIVAIVQCSGVWVIGNKFGCTFRLVQVMLLDDGSGGGGPRKISGFSFVDDSDEDRV